MPERARKRRRGSTAEASPPGGDGFHRQVRLLREDPCRVGAPARHPLPRAGAEPCGGRPGEGPAVEADGAPSACPTVERDGPAVLLLHGTHWNRVRLPVTDRLAAAGLRPLEAGLPGLGRSGAEPTPETGTVPALADRVARFAPVLRLSGPVAVAGHDTGGAVARHLLVHDRLDVSRPALLRRVNPRAKDPYSQSLRLKMTYRLVQTTAISSTANGYPPAQCSSGMLSKFMP